MKEKITYPAKDGKEKEVFIVNNEEKVLKKAYSYVS